MALSFSINKLCLDQAMQFSLLKNNETRAHEQISRVHGPAVQGAVHDHNFTSIRRR